MANLRLSLIINWGTRGWSETFYVAGEIPDVGLQKQLKAVCAARQLSFAGTTDNSVVQPETVGYRLSNTDTGKSRFFPMDDTVQRINSKIQPGDRNNYPFYQLRAGAYRRTWKQKGAPAAWINGNRAKRFGGEVPAQKVASKAFFNALSDAKVGVQAISQAGAFNIKDASIVTDATSRDFNHLVVTVEGWNAVENQQVIIKKMRGPGTNGLNGKTRVTRLLSGNQYVLAKTKCDTCKFDPDNKGTIRVFAVQIVPFDTCEFIGWSSGKLGRAFDPELGRRRKCCKR